MRDEHELRRVRLAGDGRNGASGGGLPLSDAFRAAEQHLLDNGVSPFAEAARKIAEAVIIKERRILELWGSWEAFSRDILDQLAYKKLAQRTDSLTEADLWELTASFKPGERHTVMDDPRIRLTVSNEEIRAKQNARSRAALDLNTIAASLRNQDCLTPELEGEFEGLARLLSLPPRRQGEGSSRGSNRKERPEPEPPDEPEAMRQCIGICERTLPLTREYFECYWSDRLLTSGKKKGNWYWRRDCRQCHAKAKSTGSSRNRELRAQRKEEVRLRILELGEPFPSMYQFATDLNMDANVARRVWQELHEEGKAPPPPPPRPGYPRLPGQAG